MREAFQRAAIDADDLVVHFQASISVVRRKRGREGEREKEEMGRGEWKGRGGGGRKERREEGKEVGGGGITGDQKPKLHKES